MAISQRAAASLLVAVVVAFSVGVTLAGCSPSSTGNSSTGGGRAVTGASATFSGSESGKVYMNLCSDSGTDSIFVVVDGSSTKLPGVVTKTNMNFDGTDSIYQIDKTGPLPEFSTDGNTVTLDGVKLTSVIEPTHAITLSGSITCP